MVAILKAKEISVLALFAIVFVIFALQSDRFASADNLLNVARQYSELAIVSVGLTIVIITGGIDISVGSVVGLSSAVVGVAAVERGINVWVACGLGILAGLMCGITNAVLITRMRLSPIVTTIAMMSVARGLDFVLCEARSISGFPDSFAALGQMTLGPIPAVGEVPLAVAIALGLVLLGIILLKLTAFGRGLYAVGASEEAARLSGIDVPKVKFFVYSLTGLLCGLAGVMMTARLASSVPDAGTGFEFEAITAVVMGGSSLKGGEGNITGTIIAVGIMGILRNGLNLIGVSNTWQVLFLGVMLILAVIVDNTRNLLQSKQKLR